ncbi:MAG: inositol monophosphatase [Bacteroidetes bacterium]|nr:inositol monophosphatase [Bacteroidota bacterium]
MRESELQQICMQAIPVLKRTGNYIANSRKHLRQNQIALKGVRDMVTEIDKNAEIRLVKNLKKILPEAGFITEEKTTDQISKTYNWVIDPLDGTTNFVFGIPITAVSVALMKGKKILIGMVYEISMREMFYTWQGAPSFCNGEIIHVSKQKDFSKALVATGFPYTRIKRIPGITKSIAYFLEHCQDIRRFGSAATDLCYVACGRFEIYYEGYLQQWDIAAGILIVKNAGGVVKNFEGKEDYSENKIVACNPYLLKNALNGIFLN